MATGNLELWYCDNIVSGPWPFALLALPLAGAYFYGQSQRKLGWILIGIWIPIQVAMSFVNNVVVSCPDDVAASVMQNPGGATQPQQ